MYMHLLLNWQQLLELPEFGGLKDSLPRHPSFLCLSVTSFSNSPSSSFCSYCVGLEGNDSSPIDRPGHLVMVLLHPLPLLQSHHPKSLFDRENEQPEPSNWTI